MAVWKLVSTGGKVRGGLSLLSQPLKRWRGWDADDRIWTLRQGWDEELGGLRVRSSGTDKTGLEKAQRWHLGWEGAQPFTHDTHGPTAPSGHSSMGGPVMPWLLPPEKFAALLAWTGEAHV